MLRMLNRTMAKRSIPATVLIAVAVTSFLLGRYTASPDQTRSTRVSEAARSEFTPRSFVRDDENDDESRDHRDEVRAGDATDGASGIDRSLAEALARVPRGAVAFATRQQYIDRDRSIRWHRLSEDLPDGVPTGFSLRGERALEVLPLLAGIEGVFYLRIRDCELTDEHVEQLRHLRGLVALGLSRTKITDGALVHIREFRDLRELDLSNTSITDVAMRTIARMTALRSLSIQDTGVTDEGLALLKALPHLEQLRFRGSHGATTEAALVHITQMQHLRNCGSRIRSPKRACAASPRCRHCASSASARSRA